MAILISTGIGFHQEGSEASGHTGVSVTTEDRPGTAAPPGEHDQGPPEGNRFYFKLLPMITNRPGQLSRANEAKVIVPTPMCFSQKKTQLSTHRPTLCSGCKLLPSPDTAGP